MYGYGLTYSSTICSTKFYCFKTYSNFHIHEEKKSCILFGICFSSQEKQFPTICLLLLINKCKLSSFIGCRCLNLISILPTLVTKVDSERDANFGMSRGAKMRLAPNELI